MNNSLVDDKIKELFVSYRTIAIVGVSADTNKASNRIMKFLRNTGYKVFPINPHTDNKIINGEKVYNVKGMCWATPTPCLRNTNKKIEKKYGFKIYLNN